MILDCAVYREGTASPPPGDPRPRRRLAAATSPATSCGWSRDPTYEEFGQVPKAFGLHPLAVEDALNAHQRPKLDKYETAVPHPPHALVRRRADAVETGEINIFVGERYVVTVRHGEGSDLHARAHRPGGRRQGARPRAVGGRVRRVRPGRRRLRGRRGVAPGGRRRGGVVGLLPRAHQRLRAHLHPQARGRRDASRGHAAQGADAPARRRRVDGIDPKAAPFFGDVSTTSPGPRRRSTSSTTCSPRRSRATWPGSRSSRTRTCARSPPASRWPPYPP